MATHLYLDDVTPPATGTLCARNIKRVACHPVGDPLAVHADCKTCLTVAAGLGDAPRPAPSAPCTATNRRGLVCDLGAHDDDVHQAFDGTARRNWIGDKGVTAPTPAKPRQARKTTHTVTGDHAHDLAQLHAEREDLDRRIGTRVAAARQAGESWATIGAALGITKQAAQQRYRSLRVALDDSPLPLD